MKVQIAGLISIMLLAILGAFLVYPESSEVMTEPIEEPNSWTDYHQFNNVMWSGYGNHTDLNYTHAGELTIHLDLLCAFTDYPNAPGSVNITLFAGENVLWTNETNYSQDWIISLSWNNSQPLTIVLHAVGSDSDPSSAYADWFVLTVDTTLVFVQ